MPIVTISRQPGSYGPQISRAIARNLGLEFVDRHQLHEMAKTCNAEFAKACTLYEKEEFSSFFERLMINRPAYRSLFEALHFDLASKGGVVIVGRGGHIVLKHIPSVVRIRLIAERTVRVERTMDQKGLSREEAEVYLDHFSSRHLAVLKSIFHEDIEDPHGYDLVLNTTRLTVEQSAEILCAFISLNQSGQQTTKDRETLRFLAFSKRLETQVRENIYIPPYLYFSIDMPRWGNVQLKGTVEKKQDIQKIEELIAAVDEVRHIENRLRAVDGPQA